MATNHALELVVGAMYPQSMRHLQQLLMDADACAKNHGKMSWFGRDKFQPRLLQFKRTLLTCAFSLVEDGKLDDPTNPMESIQAINHAMGLLEQTYSSWPLAFQFWRIFINGKKFESDADLYL